MAKVKRKIIKIDESKCNGCGVCIPSCKEGALKIVDGKAKLVSEVYCDGLGACLGECPLGALKIEEREVDEFNEDLAMKHVAKLKHQEEKPSLPCGCPGSMARNLRVEARPACESSEKQKSELSHWPVQLALIPVGAPYLNNANLLLLADCTAIAYASLHNDFICGKVVAIACPKLDDTSYYSDKIAQIITLNNLKSIEVVTMEVPCCSGLNHIVKDAINSSGINVPYKETVISVEGKLL